MPASPDESLIVIVDDSPPVVDVLALTLEAEGFGVVAYRSGAKFLAALTTLADPRRVLLDVGLPVLTGFDVLAQLGGARCRFPVILITGSVGESFPARAVAAVLLAGSESRSTPIGCLAPSAVHWRAVSSDRGFDEVSANSRD